MESDDDDDYFGAGPAAGPAPAAAAAAPAHIPGGLVGHHIGIPPPPLAVPEPEYHTDEEAVIDDDAAAFAGIPDLPVVPRDRLHYGERQTVIHIIGAIADNRIPGDAHMRRDSHMLTGPCENDSDFGFFVELDGRGHYKTFDTIAGYAIIQNTAHRHAFQIEYGTDVDPEDGIEFEYCVIYVPNRAILENMSIDYWVKLFRPTVGEMYDFAYRHLGLERDSTVEELQQFRDTFGSIFRNSRTAITTRFPVTRCVYVDTYRLCTISPLVAFTVEFVDHHGATGPSEQAKVIVLLRQLGAIGIHPASRRVVFVSEEGEDIVQTFYRWDVMLVDVIVRPKAIQAALFPLLDSVEIVERDLA